MSMQIVTANRLGDGLVVYRAGDGWTVDIGAATALHPDDAAALAARLQVEDRTRVVGVYAIDIGPDKLPTKGRERIRALGPTIMQAGA